MDKLITVKNGLCNDDIYLEFLEECVNDAKNDVNTARQEQAGAKDEMGSSKEAFNRKSESDATMAATENVSTTKSRRQSKKVKRATNKDVANMLNEHDYGENLNDDAVNDITNQIETVNDDGEFLFE